MKLLFHASAKADAQDLDYICPSQHLSGNIEGGVYAAALCCRLLPARTRCRCCREVIRALQTVGRRQQPARVERYGLCPGEETPGRCRGCRHMWAPCMHLGAAEARRRHFWRKPACPARPRREGGEGEVSSPAGS